MTLQIPIPYRSLAYPNLPLAVYREIAAHLQQVKGVQVELLSQDAPCFDYGQSQIKGMVIHLMSPPSPQQQEQIEAILDYYAQRHQINIRSTDNPSNPPL